VSQLNGRFIVVLTARAVIEAAIAGSSRPTMFIVGGWGLEG
jgi:hypothetical protein